MKKLTPLILCILLTSTVFGQVFDTVSYFKKYTPAQLYQDLDFLFKKFEVIHPNYFSETPRDTVIRRYNDLKGRITKPMTRIDFMDLFAPVVYGVIKDGHNYVNGPDEDLKLYTDKGGKFFPVPVEINHGKLLVYSIKNPYGTEIISINGRPAKDIVKNILSSYNPENVDYEERFLSGDFNKLYWFNYGSSEKYHITYIDNTDKQVKSITRSAINQAEIDKLRGRQQQPKKNYLFRNPNYAFYELPEMSTGVLDYKACDDLEHFRPFCDSVFSTMNKKHYKNLIIDIRTNEGGTTRLNNILYEYLTDKPIAEYTEIDTRISRDEKKNFIAANRKYAGWFKWYNYLYYPIYIRLNEKRKQALTAKNGTLVKQMYVPVKPKENPLRFNGNVYLLTSSATYSSAAIFVAAFKCYNIGTIIGQETGEPTCFTGDWVGITLPNTKLECAISNKRFILACGKCDGHGVVPDYIIDNSKPINNSTDPEMDFVKELIKK